MREIATERAFWEMQHRDLAALKSLAAPTLDKTYGIGDLERVAEIAATLAVLNPAFPGQISALIVDKRPEAARDLISDALADLHEADGPLFAPTPGKAEHLRLLKLASHLGDDTAYWTAERSDVLARRHDCYALRWKLIDAGREAECYGPAEESWSPPNVVMGAAA